ncbi:TPA: glucosyltransferase domain-containing protein [Streptococcus suis]|nr:glucosyltransferase domain-containing protein [Streptococcus suis]
MKEVINFIDYLKQNVVKLSFIFGSYLLVAIYLGSINYYYIDDIARRANGSTGFAEHYARYLSEYAAHLVQGDTHLTDLGLTTFILSAVFLGIISSLIVYFISENPKMTWGAACASLFIGLNPFSLELLSFRFDTPYMMLSILVSILPFLWKEKKILYGLSSILGIFLMYNSYQASSGIYIIFVLFLGLLSFLNTLDIKEHIMFVGSSAVYYLIATGVYYIEMMFNPQLKERGDNVSVANLSELPSAVIDNIKAYFEVYSDELPALWKFWIFIIFIIFLIQMVVRYKKSRVVTFLLTLPYVFITAMLSLGVYIASATELATVRPRYAYSLAILLGMIMVYVASNSKKNIQNIIGKIAVVIVTYYTFTFSMAYVAALDNQKTDFELQAGELASHLNVYIRDSNNTVYINRLFEDSPAYSNSSLNYPILDNLVPSNQLLYWPNIMWYNEITHSNVNFVAFDFSNIILDEFQLLTSTYNFDIYQKDNQIYVYMK